MARQVKCTPTVVPVEPFDPATDVAKLHKAMKGPGTNERHIIDILARRSIVQRLEIAEVFKKTHNKSLVKELQSELSGNFEDVILALMTPLHHFYAKELHAAVAGLGTDEEAIIEILCTLSNNGIRVVSQAYQMIFEKPLIEDLKDDVSGDFKKLVLTLAQGNREESSSIEAALSDAKGIILTNEQGQKGAAEALLKELLVSRSHQQLRQTFADFKRLSGGKDIEEIIKKEFKGDVKKALLAIVQCARSKVEYLAERLHDSMEGLGTKDRQLIRIIVARSEIDMGDIKEAFAQKYGKRLEKWIIGDTSGDYKKVLLELISA